jgi:hypothetical protein
MIHFVLRIPKKLRNLDTECTIWIPYGCANKQYGTNEKPPADAGE